MFNKALHKTVSLVCVCFFFVPAYREEKPVNENKKITWQ